MVTELTDEEIARREKIVRSRIRLTSSYPALRDAALRFAASLYGRKSGEFARREREFEIEPERLLSEHASVMNFKSARCQTLLRLANEVISQAELPMRPRGKFRGQDYHVDLDRVTWKD